MGRTSCLERGTGLKNADGVTLFNHDGWEQVYTELKYIMIVNEGSLAFKYKLIIEAEGELNDLAEVIDAYYATEPSNKAPYRACPRRYT